MNKAIPVLTFCSVLFTGCEQSALLQIRRDNAATETRIATKEDQLKAQEDQRAALLREQKDLLSELDTNQITLKELDAKLDNLRKENARIKADSEAQQKQKESLESQITKMKGISEKYQTEINALQKNDRLSADEKRKRIDELRKQIKAHFELLLKS
jgi:chromosome segregation ATPase